MENILLIFAIVLIPISTLFYIRSITKTDQKPHLGSWILYPTLEMATSLAALLNDTPNVALLPFIFGVGGVCTLYYMVKKKRYTTGPLGEMWISVTLGIIGALVGIFVQDYIWSQVAFLTGTLIASYLTAKKIWEDPYGENGLAWMSWGIISVLFVLMFLIRGTYTLAEGLTPIGYLVINLMVTIPMLIGRLLRKFEQVFID